MSKRDWRLFIVDMTEWIKKIEKYIENMSYEGFISDEKTRDAVVRNLELIGEAANQIPKEIQQKYQDIEWTQIISLRHRLIHGYFIVDYNIVWHIINSELPHLKEKIYELIKKEKIELKGD